MPLEITLTTEQKILVMVKPVTAIGSPASLDGPAAFAVTTGDCGLFGVDDRSAYIMAGDSVSDSVVEVQGDADLGAGVETIIDTILVHVQHPRATSLGLSLGQPEPK